MDIKPKRIKNELKIEMKRAICLYHEKNPKISQKDLIEEFSKQFNQKIAKSTISDILKNKKKYINSDSLNEYRERGPMYPQLKDALHIWFCDLRAQKIPLSDHILKY